MDEAYKKKMTEILSRYQPVTKIQLPEEKKTFDDEKKTFFDEKESYFISKSGEIFNRLQPDKKKVYRNCYTKEVMDIPDNKDFFMEENLSFNSQKITEQQLSLQNYNTFHEDNLSKIGYLFLDLDGVGHTSLPEEQSSINQEVTASLINHKKYVKDFAIKLGVAGAAAGLTAAGLPGWLAGVAATGLKIAGYASVAGYVGWKEMDPEKRGMVKGFILGKITPDVKTSYNFVKNRTNQMLGISPVEQKPPVDPLVEVPAIPNEFKIPKPEPALETHSVWEYLELAASITWKVMKKIHDFF